LSNDSLILILGSDLCDNSRSNGVQIVITLFFGGFQKLAQKFKV
jgi:hypothetical protein